MKEVRRIIAVVLALFMLITTGAVCASAASFSAVVTADKLYVPKYGTVVVTVSVENITEREGLLSVDIPLEFDEDIFDFVSVTAQYPSVWGTPENFSYTQAIDGLVWLRMLNDEDSFGAECGCTQSGEMKFTVTLRVKASAPLGRTTVSSQGNSAFTVLSATVADGECSVVYGTGSVININVVEPSFTVVIGDVNGDGSADNLDAAYVLRYDAMLVELNEQQLVCADVNGDAAVNSLDAATILRFDAGLITEFPAQQ